MKYLTIHESQAALDAIKAQLAKPQVAVIVDNNGVISGSIYYEEYVPNVTPVTPSHDYSQDYFTLEAIDNCDFSYHCDDGGLQYSVDGGETWSEEWGESTISVLSGEKVLLKGNMTLGDQGYGGESLFSSTGRYNIEGNIFSLYYGDNFTNITDISKYDGYDEHSGCFCEFFRNDTYIVNAEHLSLPATTLASYCYTNMFDGCTSLTTAPELPATTLAEGCYSHMFSDCTSLTTAPELPATILAEGCYSHMFDGCTSLTTAPELPATTLAKGCYSHMFHECTSLTTAPELPATILADNCYDSMFSSCGSLTTAPELPATTLADYCYDSMFSSCGSLTTAPELPATTLADNCYYSMFTSCGSLTTAPELPATTLTQYCYNNMFSACTTLNYVKCLATNISATNCVSGWLYNVASTGTFVKAASMTSWPNNKYTGIPSGWTIQDAA